MTKFIIISLCALGTIRSSRALPAILPDTKASPLPLPTIDSISGCDQLRNFPTPSAEDVDYINEQVFDVQTRIARGGQQALGVGAYTDNTDATSLPYLLHTASQLEAELLLQCAAWDSCCQVSSENRDDVLVRWFAAHPTSNLLHSRLLQSSGKCPWGPDLCTDALLYHYSVLQRWEELPQYTDWSQNKQQGEKTLRATHPKDGGQENPPATGT